MVFGRRKSSHNVNPDAETKPPPRPQEEVEVRRRNRLSKPLTSNKSYSNLALLAVPDSNGTSKNASAEAIVETPLSPSPVSPPLSEAEKRLQIKAHLFDSDDEPERKVSKRASWIGVAALVNRFEASPNSSQQSLVTPKNRNSASAIFSRKSSGSKRPGLSNANSVDGVTTLSDQPTNSSAVSLDRTPEPAFPTSRRASFQPGVATRKSSGIECIQEQDESFLAQHQKQDAIEEEDDMDSDVLSFSEGDDDEWFPPPQEPRAATPESLDYTHLGGLRLGSLQVMNGRASPATSVAASMASRHLLAQMAVQRGRDTSSDYGDGDAGDGPPYTLNANPRSPAHSREVSWYSQRPSRLHHVEIFELPTRTVREAPAVDLAAAMAAEYIAELPSSPYKLGRRSSSPSLREEPVEQMPVIAELSFSPHQDLRRSQSLETLSHRSDSPAPSVQSESGSVLRTTTKATEIDDELFDDESLGPSRASPIPPLEPAFAAQPTRTSIDSFYSWQSSPRKDFARHEAFESAVEFQSYPSPQKLTQQSPKRKPVPTRHPLFEARELSPEAPTQRLEIPVSRGMVNSDSGYSSNNSVRSSSWERKSMMDQQRNQSPQRPQQQSDLQFERSKLHKPILKTRKTAPAVPSFSELQPAPPSSTASVTSETPTVDTEKRKPKKLQKRNIFGKKKQKELFCQSVASVDDLTIPAIPPEIQANLQIRTQHVPELEKTYRTSSHISNRASMSIMDLPKMDLKFPEPEPEQAPPPQNKSRRRSWLPGSKEVKPKPKHTSMLSERDAKMMVKDFGSVNHYLGGNPYDLAREGPPPVRKDIRQLTPSNVSTQRPQSRSTFDARTAAEIARLRSNSIKERDAWNERKGSFNDRGGIPGKKFRPASMAGDAPPMPTLPTAEDLQRRLSDRESQQAPPPPPPKHSPRPLYVEPEGIIDELELAPPPPSHSPRPMDVTEEVDPWAAQAAAWKARRNGADQSWKRASYHEEDYYQPAEEPLYPNIPLRQTQSAYQAQRSYSYQPGTHENHDYNLDTHHNQYHEPQHQYQPYHPEHDYQSYHHRPPRQSQYPQPHTQYQNQPCNPSYDQPQSRPLPAPKGPRRSPAPSIRSFRSNASSMAEDIHPELAEHASRPHPPPEFGRYSGGMQYGYERENGGFGGSAGTRSVSGKADLAHKGVMLRQEVGLDFGDIPTWAR